jgi:hypothetical protein
MNFFFHEFDDQVFKAKEFHGVMVKGHFRGFRWGEFLKALETLEFLYRRGRVEFLIIHIYEIFQFQLEGKNGTQGCISWK